MTGVEVVLEVGADEVFEAMFDEEEDEDEPGMISGTGAFPLELRTPPHSVSADPARFVHA